MKNNKLKLNDSKTHLMVITSSSKAKQNEKHLVQLHTSSGSIMPTETEKLLGCFIQDNLKWTCHIISYAPKLTQCPGMY